MKYKVLITATAMSLAAPALAAEVITFNTNPSITFSYGIGNNYDPANAAVLSTSEPMSELATRAHIFQEKAAPSDASGVYSFALGSAVSFDYSFKNFMSGQYTLINLKTGQSFTTGLFQLGNAVVQDSQRLSFGFINGPSSNSLGFNSAIDDTYQINIIGNNSSGSHTDTIFAKLGAGVGAVPEPTTWALMLAGFGAIGCAMRRRQKVTTRVTYVA